MGAPVSLELGSGGARPADITAWHPAVPGIVEVFHARFVDHAYPLHTHDTWTVLIVVPSEPRPVRSRRLG